MRCAKLMHRLKPSYLTRPLLIFMSTMILANIAGHMYQPLLPLYLQSLGASVEQVGLFFTLGAVAPLLFQILGGWLSDSLGRLQAIAVGSIAGALGYIVFWVAPSWQWLLVFTVASALSRAFVGPSYMAFLAEQATEETRGQVFGLAEGMFMVVGVIGPPIGGYVSEHFGFKAMFAVAGILYTGATVIRLFMARNAIRSQPVGTAARPKPSFAGLKTSLLAMTALITTGGIVTWIMISDGVRDVTYNLAFQLHPLYMQNIGGLSNVEIGWLVSMSSATTMLLMTPAGWFSDRKGERVGIVCGFAIYGIALAIFVNAKLFAGFAAAWLLFGLGEALIGPAFNSLVSKAVPLKLRGTAFGLFNTSTGIISLPAPYLGAYLWERIAPQAPFYVPLLASLLLLPIMWIKFKLPKTDADQALVAGEAVSET